MTTGRKTGGRQKGTPNRRSQMLLRKLEDDHNFHIIKELVNIFQGNKEKLEHLLDKMGKNQQEGKPLDVGMSDGELIIYQQLTKDQLNILVRLLSYCYPKLKATEINTGSGEKIVFNISGMPNMATE